MCGGVPRLIDKLRIILCRHEACADIPVAAVIILRATYGILLLLHTTPYSTYFFILCSIRYFALYVLRIRTGIYSAACAYSSGCHDLKKAQPVAHTLTCRGTTCGGGGVGPVTMRRWPHRPASHGSLQGSSSCFLCDQRSLAALCGRHLHSFSVLLSFLLLFFTSSSSPPLLVSCHSSLFPCPRLHNPPPASNHPETAPSGRPSQSHLRQSWRNLGFSPGRNLESAL